MEKTATRTAQPMKNTRTSICPEREAEEGENPTEKKVAVIKAPAAVPPIGAPRPVST